MTHEEAHRLNQRARDWAESDPAGAFATVIAALDYADTVPFQWKRRRAKCEDLLRQLADTPSGHDGLSLLAAACEAIRLPSNDPTRELPRFSRVSDKEARTLPGFEVGSPPVRDAILPGFDGVASSVPSWLLSVYDQAGGKTEARGRGAPWPLRLFVGALLSLPIEFRDGRQQLMPLTTRELARWLLPGGWDRRPAAFERLRRALRDLDRLRIPVPVEGTSGMSLRLVDCVGLPLAYDRGRGPVVLRVSIPAGAARGARVEWERLTQYGAESAPLYRAYLSAVAVLDYSARAGRALTPHVPSPLRDTHGNPQRRKGGAIVRSKVTMMPNPAGRFVRWLSPDDVRAMVGLAADTRTNVKRARDALEHLEADGVVAIERRQDGLIRLWAPDKTVTTGYGNRDNRVRKP